MLSLGECLYDVIMFFGGLCKAPKRTWRNAISV